MQDETIIEHTRRWISKMVVGLNLCPFARKPFEADTIHYAVSRATDPKTLLFELGRELRALAEATPQTRETTLLIHPAVLDDFLEFNDFLGIAEELVEDLGLAGEIQIASFHPEYQFADSDSQAVENFTNRSPYPMLHLLREDSISAVASDREALLEIPKRNERTLRGLGKDEVIRRLKSCTNSD